MRGHQQSAVRAHASEAQSAFRSLSRHRRSKLARVAQTTLVKADQWGRGDAVAPDVSTALEGALQALQAKGGSKKG
jgi:hypothetical protein